MSMKKALTAVALLVGFSAHAGQEEMLAAKGVMITSILHEKCTGQKAPPKQVERQVMLLKAQGATAAEIEAGFIEGIMYAEGSYPGKRKPPLRECNEAVHLYTQMKRQL